MMLEELVKLFDFSEKKEKFDSEVLDTFLKDLTSLLLFDYYHQANDEKEIEELYSKVEEQTSNIFDDDEKKNVFLSKLPEIRKTLDTSIIAILDGDPASESKQQIVLEYPGFKAILNYRIAHEFYFLNKKLIARYISEIAHQQTGIDINPGATIGDYFFIDHGTGIVIGETCIIGNHVKIYQGVTLGALSLSKGRDLIGKKRHPTVEDNVTIYSNAAIFGGETIIHKGSIIGGDVYLTHSVEENSVVLQTDDNLTIVKKN